MIREQTDINYGLFILGWLGRPRPFHHVAVHIQSHHLRWQGVQVGLRHGWAVFYCMGSVKAGDEIVKRALHGVKVLSDM